MRDILYFVIKIHSYGNILKDMFSKISGTIKLPGKLSWHSIVKKEQKNMCAFSC